MCPERRIIVAEKKELEHEGAYENMRRNGRVFRHMCFVSVEFADENRWSVSTVYKEPRSGSQPQCDAF